MNGGVTPTPWKPVEPTRTPSSINNRLLWLALDFPQIGSPPLNVAYLFEAHQPSKKAGEKS